MDCTLQRAKSTVQSALLFVLYGSVVFTAVCDKKKSRIVFAGIHIVFFCLCICGFMQTKQAFCHPCIIFKVSSHSAHSDRCQNLIVRIKLRGVHINAVIGTAASTESKHYFFSEANRYFIERARK